MVRVGCFLTFLAAVMADDVGPPHFPAKVSRAVLLSISNENDRFVLDVHGPDSFSNGTFHAMIGGRDFYFSAGGSPSSPGIYSAQTQAFDEGAVKNLIEFFHPIIKKRHHPGHRMLVKFIPAKKKFVWGEPVNVTLRITNVGDASFAYQEGGQQRGMRDNQFAFSAHGITHDKMLPDIGSPRHMGGINGPVVIKPGEDHEISVDLTKWFQFEKGQSYRVRGSYEMSFLDPASAKSGDLEDYMSVIWLDYATAAFGVSFEP